MDGEDDHGHRLVDYPLKVSAFSMGEQSKSGIESEAPQGTPRPRQSGLEEWALDAFVLCAIVRRCADWHGSAVHRAVTGTAIGQGKDARGIRAILPRPRSPASPKACLATQSLGRGLPRIWISRTLEPADMARDRGCGHLLHKFHVLLSGMVPLSESRTDLCMRHRHFVHCLPNCSPTRSVTYRVEILPPILPGRLAPFAV